MGSIQDWVNELTKWEDFYVSFARHMVDEHDWDMDAVLYFFEKPHKWNKEIGQYVETDGPCCGADEEFVEDDSAS